MPRDGPISSENIYPRRKKPKKTGKPVKKPKASEQEAVIDASTVSSADIDWKNTRALSIRQPWAELIMLGNKEEEEMLREKAYAALYELNLHEHAFHPAAGLPFGTLKRVELARALIGDPKLLMLDEPASGLTHSEVDELAADIRALRDKYNLTVLLVEHHMRMVMAISEKIVVMNFGKKIQEGDPQVVRNDPAVIAAYLGGEAA